jgi:hypoxanthine phosphoribosyltransferase
VQSTRRCEVIGLDRVYELSFELTEAVRRAGYQPDLVVAIARGGFVPARLVCDFLRCRDLTSLGVRHYAPGALREDKARIVDPLRVDVGGRRVLVVDDVNDSGDTLDVARAHLAERRPADVRVAVLHEKPHSHARADFRAAEAANDRWLVYQWAVIEDALGFLEQVEPPPGTPGECRRRLEADLGIELADPQWEKVVGSLPQPPGAVDRGAAR